MVFLLTMHWRTAADRMPSLVLPRTTVTFEMWPRTLQRRRRRKTEACRIWDLPEGFLIPGERNYWWRIQTAKRSGCQEWLLVLGCGFNNIWTYICVVFTIHFLKAKGIYKDILNTVKHAQIIIFNCIHRKFISQCSVLTCCSHLELSKSVRPTKELQSHQIIVTIFSILLFFSWMKKFNQPYDLITWWYITMLVMQMIFHYPDLIYKKQPLTVLFMVFKHIVGHSPALLKTGNLRENLNSALIAWLNPTEKHLFMFYSPNIPLYYPLKWCSGYSHVCFQHFDIFFMKKIIHKSGAL